MEFCLPKYFYALKKICHFIFCVNYSSLDRGIMIVRIDISEK